MDTLNQPKNFRVVAGVALLVVTLAVVLFFSVPGSRGMMRGWMWNANGAGSAVQHDRYYGVFLSNGQVYFGKIARLDDDFLRLTDIYYLQSNDALQGEGAAGGTGDASAAEGAAASDLSLVKLGAELHGPEDTMNVNMEHVLYYELLKDDSQVVKAIRAYKQGS